MVLSIKNSCDKALNRLTNIGLHKLYGNRAGQWAMTVNGPWRVCFRFKNGNAYDVQITDYHLDFEWVGVFHLQGT